MTQGETCGHSSGVSDAMARSHKASHFTAPELASMRLPGLPGTPQGIRQRAAAEGWAVHEAQGRGGQGGKQYRFTPPAYVLALIEPGGSSSGAAVQGGRAGSEITVDEVPRGKRRGRQKERPLSMVIGERLRAIRATRDAEEFAQLCDVSAADLRAWEQGDAMLPGWMVLQLHQVLGVNPMFLLAGILPIHIGQGSTVEAKAFPTTPDTVEILSELALVAGPVFSSATRGEVVPSKDRTEVLLLAFGLLQTAGLCATADDVRSLGAAELKQTIRLAMELHRLRKRGPDSSGGTGRKAKSIDA